jgi:1-acyl-sn-glycerol-3-phosphate acyltransferase
VSAAKARSEKTPTFRILAAFVVPMMAAISKLEIENKDKMPREGAFVLAPNHYSNLDPVVMALAVWKLGRAPRFLAKASLFNVPVVGAALRGTGQIPVERVGSTRNHEPLKAANELVANGHCIIIYPEGTLTRDPGLWPMRGKTGAVRMALEQNIPIVPSAHWGTQKIMPRYSKKISLFPRKTIHITFGDPVDLSEFADKPLNAVTLREATEVVMAAVTKLVEDLRDETAPIERWNPTAHKQSETGHFE